MKGLGYYYDRKRFETVEAAVEYYKAQKDCPKGTQVNIIYCGVLVGNIDVDRLSAEINRHASGR